MAGFLRYSRVWESVRASTNLVAGVWINVTGPKLNVNKLCFSTQGAGLYSGRKYTENHNWVQVNGKIATVGLTHHAQESLGKVTNVQLPEVGVYYFGLLDLLAGLAGLLGGVGGVSGDSPPELPQIETVKVDQSITHCGISGMVVATNSAVEDEPGLINSSCYDKGWLYKLQMSNPAELDKLMDEEDYNNFLNKN